MYEYIQYQSWQSNKAERLSLVRHGSMDGLWIY